MWVLEMVNIQKSNQCRPSSFTKLTAHLKKDVCYDNYFSLYRATFSFRRNQNSKVRYLNVIQSLDGVVFVSILSFLGCYFNF